MAAEEAPECADADAHATLVQLGLELSKTDVGHSGHLVEKEGGLCLDPAGLGSPPCFLGAILPVVLSCAAQRIALDALTPNRAATCRCDMP